MSECAFILAIYGCFKFIKVLSRNSPIKIRKICSTIIIVRTQIYTVALIYTFWNACYLAKATKRSTGFSVVSNSLQESCRYSVNVFLNHLQSSYGPVTYQALFCKY